MCDMLQCSLIRDTPYNYNIIYQSPVSDGAKQRWKDLVLLDAIAAFAKEAISKGYGIERTGSSIVPGTSSSSSSIGDPHQPIFDVDVEG